MQCALTLLDGLILPPDTDVTSFEVTKDATGKTIVDFSSWLTIRTGPARTESTLHPFEVHP